ncbi:glutaredoxin 3 [Archangium sp.]|jgi:glutaredoxin 3|uniref:glutaredoxin 3 n=1 Tax=Archangium sp. TaxID=1872627 RepID=UPI002ED82B19
MRQVTLYTKTYCAYSKRAKALLSEQGVEFEDIDVTEDEARFAEMVERTGGGTTVPQIFIAGRHVGGFTELAELHERGELDALRGSENTASSPA